MGQGGPDALGWVLHAPLEVTQSKTAWILAWGRSQHNHNGAGSSKNGNNSFICLIHTKKWVSLTLFLMAWQYSKGISFPDGKTQIQRASRVYPRLCTSARNPQSSSFWQSRHCILLVPPFPNPCILLALLTTLSWHSGAKGNAERHQRSNRNRIYRDCSSAMFCLLAARGALLTFKLCISITHQFGLSNLWKKSEMAIISEPGIVKKNYSLNFSPHILVQCTEIC